MDKLFGIPVATLAVVLAVALGATLAVIAALALRNRIFVRLGVRNVLRRPGRSALIVAGLMLGTAIVAAALATGDTMSHTIRQSALVSLGETDEVVPGLHEQDGYEGLLVLLTPEGKGMLITMWSTEEAVRASAAFAAAAIQRFTEMMFFKAPPGREHYEVALAELPGVTVG